MEKNIWPNLAPNDTFVSSINVFCASHSDRLRDDCGA